MAVENRVGNELTAIDCDQSHRSGEAAAWPEFGRILQESQVTHRFSRSQTGHERVEVGLDLVAPACRIVAVDRVIKLGDIGPHRSRQNVDVDALTKLPGRIDL